MKIISDFSTNEKPQPATSRPWWKKKLKLWEGTLALVIITIVVATFFISAFSSFNKGLFRADIVSFLDNSDNRSDRAKELLAIKAAIKEKGVQWEADDNEIFQLSDADRKKRANLEMDETLPASSAFQAEADTVVPSSFDWRNNFGNYVTPIRDQGQCGSCWAFGVTAGNESSNLIKAGTPSVDLNLSEQILVSCCPNCWGSSTGGCGGGYISSATNYVRDTGLPLESCFTYKATNTACSGACANWQATTTYKIGSYISVPQDLNSIKQALTTYGPLVSAFYVYSDFYSYRSGVYSHISGNLVGGHAILIVGYDDPGQYFIVKNSWGTGWGESGYFRIAYSQIGSPIYFGRSTYAYSSIAPVLAGITVTSPNGTEVWEAGGLASKQITWNYLGDSSALVKIDLLKAGAVVKNIISSVSVSNKSAIWNVPADQTIGDDYKIKITSIGNGVNDASDANFFVVPLASSTLTLTSPVGGESFNTRGNMAIKWSYSGNPGLSLKIDLLRNGALAQNITTGISTASGSYTWKIPTSQIATSTYQIRITSNTDSKHISTSAGFFTITGSGGSGKKK